MPRTRKASPRASKQQAELQPISERFPALREQEVVLTFYAADAKVVQVAGTFNDWRPEATPLEHTGSGDWAVRLTLKSGLYEYHFVVDGVWTDDPQAEQSVANPFGGLNSVLKVGLDDRTDLL
jgi:1,4-alpha-glucan branching enzyme